MKSTRLPPARPSEALLVSYAANVAGENFLCTTLGRGQLAGVVANLAANRTVTLAVFDHYQQTQSQPYHETHNPNVTIICQPDLPLADYDACFVPLVAKGDKELTRDLLQNAFLSLREGGELIAAIDHPRDHWLHEEFQKYFDKITRTVIPKQGVIYQAKKRGTIKKMKDHTAQAAFRFGEQLVMIKTRPGVFSHRQVDGGARALIKAMNVKNGMRVLDVGCGSGAVGIAAGLAAENVLVHAVDSNPRAVACSQENAAAAGLTNYQAVLDSEGASVATQKFDLVLANPPYFSNYRIAELFIMIGVNALKIGGSLLLVTKAPKWYLDHSQEMLKTLEPQTINGYHVLHFQKIKAPSKS